MRQPEWYTDGWIAFERIYCKEGFIDYWAGDGANNPNNKKMNLNKFKSFHIFFRLNENTYWLPGYLFYMGFYSFLLLNKNLFDAEFLWNCFLKHDNV